MESFDQDKLSAMDVLLVIVRSNLQGLTTKILSEAVYSAFGKRCHFLSYDNYYLVEFPNKTTAMKALEEGLLCNLQRINFITLHEYFNTLA